MVFQGRAFTIFKFSMNKTSQGKTKAKSFSVEKLIARAIFPTLFSVIRFLGEGMKASSYARATQDKALKSKFKSF